MISRESLAAMALTRIKGLSQRQALALYRHVGTALPLVEGSRDGLLDLVPDMSRPVLKAIVDGRSEALARAEEEAAFCEQYSIRALPMADEDYPFRLRDCADAPLVLYYRGNASLNAPRILSMVGTRRCTDYGKSLCADLLRELACLCPDTMVVSGLAYGIDIHAHRGALAAGLDTVAVLAHGLDRIYPSMHRATAREMLDHGGLLTEYMSKTNPDKGNFVCRNRIVAGLCDACLVVESAAKGGALITARLAGDYGREVMAVPGRIGDETSQGCNRLIYNNEAALVSSAEDIVQLLNWPTVAAVAAKTGKRGYGASVALQASLFESFSEEERTLLMLLAKADSKAINQLVVESHMPIYRVSALLAQLEIRGAVKNLVGGRFALVK